MVKKLVISGFSLFLLSFTPNVYTAPVAPCDKICGRWQSEKKNCIVEVSRDDDDFVAKLVWFDASDDATKPMETRVDYKNPDKNLRNRKLIGMSILEGLEYKPKTDSWENGKIYDAQTGKHWSAAASLVSPTSLKVTGYWHFKFIGRSMVFHRIQ